MNIHQQNTTCFQTTRLDGRSDVLPLSITFECRLHTQSFAFCLPRVDVGPRDVVGDPFFLCPQRQRHYIANKKDLGLGLVMKLLPA